MSIGNLKDNGNKGNNFPWQLKVLLGQQSMVDQLIAINGNTDAVEFLLTSILTTLQDSTEYEAKFAVDTCDSDKVYLEVRVWNPDTSTWGPITYYLPGSDTPVVPVGAGTPGCLKYTDPSTLLGQILNQLIDIKSDTANLDVALSTRATEATSANILAELQAGITTFTSIDLAKDFFKNLITVTPYNQIELRLDQASYSEFVNENTFNTGAITQTGGLLFLNTGVDAAGKATIESIDSIEYRPGAEIFAGGTATFTAPAANNIRRIGLVDDIDTFNNSLTFGYEGTTFGIRYTSGGVVQLNVAQASWDDPCDGTAGSKFTLGGTPVALDHTKGNIYRFRAGLFGFAGWVAEILSPDGDWVEVYRYKHNNVVATPVFTSNTLNVVLYNENTGNTTDLEISAQCWNGGGTSQFDRINSTLTDRTLAQTVRSVITGVTTGGGGGYVNVKVNPSGALTVEATIEPTSVTPNIIRATGAGSIPAGARSFSIANVGAADGDILGGTNNIKAGEVLNFDAGLNNTYGAVAYDATGTELLITYNN